LIDSIPDLKQISLDRWDDPAFRRSELRADVIRLDKIHPDISGNKWFKLKFYLEKARQLNLEKLISYGGAYSNHLLALAAAAKINGLHAVGRVRGEEPAILSHTLREAKNLGMKLEFLSRTEYSLLKNSAERIDRDSKALIIPEGGAGPEGVRGAGCILPLISYQGYTHICCAVGTGTTLAGIANMAERGQKIIGISVLKGTQNFEPLDLTWIKPESVLDRIKIFHQEHFGGYAKYTPQLISFMNGVFKNSQIPTDFVYTGKLFFAIARLALEQYFPAGSKLLIIHSGGLQGNQSLQEGLLEF
jgi:1-aminocyclopropane-1-carboxylate deaminase